MNALTFHFFTNFQQYNCFHNNKTISVCRKAAWPCIVIIYCMRISVFIYVKSLLNLRDLVTLFLPHLTPTNSALTNHEWFALFNKMTLKNQVRLLVYFIQLIIIKYYNFYGRFFFPPNKECQFHSTFPVQIHKITEKKNQPKKNERITTSTSNYRHSVTSQDNNNKANRLTHFLQAKIHDYQPPVLWVF